MCSSEQFEELRLLSQFSLESTATGIKVHANEAPDALVEAASRLYAKGLTDHVDGGYLTARGVEAAHHAQSLLRLLS